MQPCLITMSARYAATHARRMSARLRRPSTGKETQINCAHGKPCAFRFTTRRPHRCDMLSPALFSAWQPTVAQTLSAIVAGFSSALQVAPSLAKICHDSADSRQIWPNSIGVGPNAYETHTRWHTSHESGPNSTEVDPTSANFGAVSTGFRRFRGLWAQFRKIRNASAESAPASSRTSFRDSYCATQHICDQSPTTESDALVSPPPTDWRHRHNAPRQHGRTPWHAWNCDGKQLWLTPPSG